MFANLDEATKEKAEVNFRARKSGTLTREQAKAKLKELGVKLPRERETWRYVRD